MSFGYYQVADWGFVVIMSIRSTERRRTVVARALAVVVALAIISACGGGDDAGDDASTPRPTTTTTEPTTTSTTLDETTQKIEAAKAAYLAYRQAYRTAAAEPVMPHLPEIQALMTGLQQTQITANLEGMQARGEAARLPDNTQEHHEILTASMQPDGSVRLKACSINDAVVYNVATGAIVDDRVTTSILDVTVVQEGDAWKVAGSVITDKQDGQAPCTG
jgi:hypothetical protein